VTVPRKGPGHFQWSTGGWFGSLVGSTILILLLGILYWENDRRVAAVVLTTYMIAMAIGLGLWLYRDRLLPYHGLQLLVLVSGIAFAVALATLDVFDYLGGRGIYVILLIYPMTMLRFYVQERQARKLREFDEPAAGDEPPAPDGPP
jgi:hypothetical protein